MSVRGLAPLLCLSLRPRLDCILSTAACLGSWPHSQWIERAVGKAVVAHGILISRGCAFFVSCLIAGCPSQPPAFSAQPGRQAGHLPPEMGSRVSWFSRVHGRVHELAGTGAAF